MASIRSMNGVFVLFQAILAIGLGAAIAFVPVPTVAVALALLVLAVCVAAPKQSLLALGGFLLLQDLLVGVAEQSSEQLGQVMRNADEGLIILLTISAFARRVPAAHSITAPLAGLIVAGVASTFFQDAPTGPALQALLLMIKGFLLYMVAVRLDVDTRDIHTFLRCFAIACAALVASVVLNYAAPDLQESLGLGNVQYRFGFRAAQGILGHPGAFGQLMAFSTLYAFALYWSTRNRTSLILGLVFAAGLLLSLRLRLVLEIPLTLLAGPILLGARRRGIFVVLALTFAAATVPTGLLSSLVAEKSQELEGGARIALMETSAEIARDHFPLGTGFGTFGGSVSSVYYSPVYYEYNLDTVYGLSPSTLYFIPDNYWAHVLGETGVLGAGAYVLILVQVLRALRKVVRSGVDPTITGLAAGCVLVLVLATVEGFTSPVFQASLNVYLALPAAGLVIAAAAQHRPVADSRDERIHLARDAVTTAGFDRRI